LSACRDDILGPFDHNGPRFDFTTLTMNVELVASFFLLAGGMIVALSIVGAPIQMLLRSLGLAGELPSPLLGMGFFVLLSWYWLKAGHALGSLIRPLVVVSLIVTFVAYRPWQVSALGQRLRAAAERRSLHLLLGCFVAFGACAFVLDGAFFARTHFTVLSLGNNDVPSYVLHSQALLDGGFDDPGSMVGSDLGKTSAEFGFGSYGVLALGAAVAGVEVWKAAQPVMFASVVLLSYGIALVLERLVEARRVAIPVVAATLGCAAFLTSFIVGNYFLGQILGGAVVASEVALLVGLVPTEPRRRTVARVLALSILITAGLAIYPHMQAVAVFVLLPGVLVAGGLQGVFRRALFTTASVVAGFVTSAIYAPGLGLAALRAARELASRNAGWPSGGFLPTDLLGFQSSSAPQHGTVAWTMSGLLVSIVVLAAWAVGKTGSPRLARYAIATIAAILVSYGLVYLKTGASYRQWKWITFFDAGLVATVVAVALSLGTAFEGRRRGLFSISVGLVGVYAVVLLAMSSFASFPATASIQQYVETSPDQIRLQQSPKLKDIASVNIRVNPYWDTMWVVYFLREKTVYPLSLSYYPTVAAGSDWTIERNDQPLEATALESVKLNDTYRLVLIAHGRH
jgi:hypothetical protein